MTEVKSDAGAVDLLCAIFDKDRCKARYRLGLPNKLYPCPFCGKLISKGMYCNSKCWQAHHQVPVICSECGKLYYILQSVYFSKGKTKRILEERFCSKKCYGRWFSKLHRPASPNLGYRKYDYKQVAKVRWLLYLGLTLPEISKETSIPRSTIEYILKRGN